MRLYLLIRKDTKIRDIKSLANKTIDVPNWLINDIGGLYLNTYLLENKLPAFDKFFSNVQKSKNSNQSIINLFFKKNDAALVSETELEIATELNPQIMNQLLVLQTSDYFPALVSACLKSTSKETCSQAKSAALEVNNSRKGKAILKLLHSSGFYKAEYDDMKIVKSLLYKYQQLKAFVY